LKPGAFKLWGNWIRELAQPHQVASEAGELRAALELADDGLRSRIVAVQVAFERQTLKPVFHLIGDRLWV
jgi:hypothetical protein